MLTLVCLSPYSSIIDKRVKYDFDSLNTEELDILESIALGTNPTIELSVQLAQLSPLIDRKLIQVHSKPEIIEESNVIRLVRTYDMPRPVFEAYVCWTLEQTYPEDLVTN
jgi:hypothetical protein